MSIFFLLPLLLIGAAAVAGFGTSWLLTGMRVGHFNNEERLNLAIGLSVAVPVVAATTILVPRLDELQSLYGAFVHDLWLWALGAYAIGCIFGWAFCAQAE